MSEEGNSKKYDLEDRTHLFAKHVRAFVKQLPRNESNINDVRQLIRSSGSIGANYIEANEALGNKDFLMHVRISRKESKESRHWIDLLDTNGDLKLDSERSALFQEATELMNIFGAIIRKCE